jgi:hypothetical protein
MTGTTETTVDLYFRRCSKPFLIGFTAKDRLNGDDREFALCCDGSLQRPSVITPNTPDCQWHVIRLREHMLHLCNLLGLRVARA